MADTTFGPKGWTPERLGSLGGKTFVITGTTAGLGTEASRILLSKGAKLVMLNRNVAKAAATIETLKQQVGDHIDVTAIEMDLSSLSSVRKAADEVLAAAPRIDALIENAAIAQVPKRVLTQDGFESQMGTNHCGHFLLTGLLFDRLEQSKGRVVVVSSLGYKLGMRTINFGDINWDNKYNPNAAYSQSKLAQMMMAYELQDRVKAAGKNVEAYVCHPGASSTSLISTSGSLMMRAIWKVMTWTPMVQSAEAGAYGQLMCATEDGLEQRAFYGPTGFQEAGGPVGAGTLEPHAYEKEVMTKLWAWSEDATGLNWPV